MWLPQRGGGGKCVAVGRAQAEPEREALELGLVVVLTCALMLLGLIYWTLADPAAGPSLSVTSALARHQQRTRLHVEAVCVGIADATTLPPVEASSAVSPDLAQVAEAPSSSTPQPASSGAKSDQDVAQSAGCRII